MYPGCLTCVAITWMNSSGASLCFNHMNEEFLGGNRLHISCCCFFLSFTAPQMIESCQQLICSNRQKPSGALNPPKMFSQFSANSWSQHICNIHIIWKWTQTISIYLSQMFMHLRNNKSFRYISPFPKLWNQSFAHCNQEDWDTWKQIQTQLKEKKTLRILQNFGTLADLLTFQKPKYNLKTLLSLQNQSLGFVHPAQWQNADQKLNNPNVGKCLIPKPTKTKMQIKILTTQYLAGKSLISKFPNQTNTKMQIKILTTQSSGKKLDFKFLHQQKTNNQNQSPQNQGREKRFKDSF